MENKVADLEFWQLRWWKIWDGETLKRPWNYTFREDDSLSSGLSCSHGGDESDPETWKYDWADLVVALVRLLQRNRASMIYVELIRSRFIMETGSYDYRDQEVPWYAICRLEPQESPWDNSAWVRRCENLRCMVWALVWVWKPWYPVSEGRRCWVCLLKRINFLCSLCSTQAISGWEDTAFMREGGLLYSIDNSNAYLFQSRPHRHT